MSLGEEGHDGPSTLHTPPHHPSYNEGLGLRRAVGFLKAALVGLGWNSRIVPTVFGQLEIGLCRVIDHHGAELSAA